MIIKTLGVSAVVAAMALGATSASASTVSLELMLLTDTSGSVDATDFNLMREGYALAFESAAVQQKILDSATGSIAVAISGFSTGYDGLRLGWTEINSVASANAFAAAIRGFTRGSHGSTNILAGITGAAAEFATNSFDAARQVIDLAGDGSQSNSGCSHTQAICVPLQNARDAVLAGETDTINALFIDDTPYFGDGPGFTIDSIDYGNDNVIGGTNAFVASVSGFDTFAKAIENKIAREIAPPAIPVPAGLPLLLGALAGLGMLRRRKAA